MRKYLKIKRAKALIDKFRGVKVLVIGDLIMDHFLWGKVRRISPEAPVPVVEVARENLMLGGSANVANNIRSLGGSVFITGVIGRDDDGKKFVSTLREKGIKADGIAVDPKRPTTTKTRIIAHSQQVVRFDREKKDEIGRAVSKKVVDYMKRAARSVDIVIVSDYAKGLITRPLVEEVMAEFKKLKKPVVVDPKVEHLDYYRGATVVTPNNLEASVASGVEIEDDKTLKRAGEALLETLDSKALLITRGEHGMSLFERGHDTHIPTVAKEVFDVSGAGDTVVGVLAMSLAAGANFKEAAVLANFAAGVVVGKIGTATVTRAELAEAAARGLKAWPA
ncbi:MAG: D-glycero-beta-D-manno-heptose-7-phosphate kinase [Thermodesulfobacteriota bacterium]